MVTTAKVDRAMARNTTAKPDKIPPKKPRGTPREGTSTVEYSSELKQAVAQIERQFGEGAIMALGSQQLAQIEGISTGSLSLDIALGGPGIPRGRVAEVYGPESSGKTTLALHVVAQ